MEELPINSVEPDDQDSAWKDLLDACLQDFMAFFFPHIECEVDWTRPYEPMDKELARLRPNLPSGKLYADKLYQVWLKNGQAKWVLIHIEVQGRAGRGFAKRVFDYNYRISFKHPGMDVVSLAVITETKRPVKGRYERSAFGCSLAFTFPLAQLATYANKLAELEKNPNPFALAVAVQLKALETRGDNQGRTEWKRAFIVGLGRRRYPRQKIEALLRFMDEAMRLPEALEELVKNTTSKVKGGKKMPYVTSWERIAKRKGEHAGMLFSLTTLLSHKFGEINGTLQAKLEKLSPAQMQSLFADALKFETKSELAAWLKQNTNSSAEHHNGKHSKKKSQ